MRVDLYTKAVLTVIAACLVWMCINGVMPVASAQADRAEPAPVIFVDPEGAPIYTSDGFRVNPGTRALPVSLTHSSLPVEVTNAPLPVTVRSIQRGTAWDPIQVQVMREPPTLRPVP